MKQMKKRRIRHLTLVAVIAGIIAVFTAESFDEPSSCFIWKVEINESIFYLAGSIHSAGEGNYPLAKAYTESYKKSDKVILELEDDFETLEQEIFKYAEKDRLKEDQYLNLHLSPESLEKLKQLFDDDKLARYFQYESWLLYMAIAGTKSRLIGYDPLLAIDKYFHELSKKDGKEIIGLDDIQTQLLLFDFELPFEMQVKIIEKAVSEMEVEAKKEIPLFKAYFDNDMVRFEEEFLKLFDFNKPQMKQIYDMVFTSRNTNWVERLEKISSDKPGTYFVLVGSGHFFGPNNIRELLDQKGYTIENM